MVFKMNKAGVFFGTGYEEIEALAVVDLLRRAEIETDMISITDAREVESAHGIWVKMDKTLQEVDFEQFDIIVLPGGGMGTANLEACPGLMEQVDIFYEKEKCIAAICAAPSILGHRGMLKGRKACSYPSFESHLEGAKVVQEAAIKDGHIITGRGMGCAIQFGLAIVAHFKGQAEADDLAEKIIFMR